MPSIFISYRREDSSGWTGRLAEHLRNKLGIDSIFMDLDTIQPGADFADVLRSAVSSCDLVLAIIGPAWSSTKTAEGQPRLQDINDWVRIELATALSKKCTVIPVLVGSARMPNRKDLPEDLKELAGRQAFEITDKRWRFDCDQLISSIERHFPNTGLRASVALPLSYLNLKYAAWLGIATTIVIATVMLAQMRNRSSSDHVFGDSRPSDSVQSVDASRIDLGAGQVAHLEAPPWSATYTILAVLLDRDRPDGDTYHSFLTVRVRLKANTQHPVSFWKDGFRLLVDGERFAPTNVTEAVVEGNSTKDGEVTFQLPDGGRTFSLELRLGDKAARIAIEIPTRS